jgi:hypothetical protein
VLDGVKAGAFGEHPAGEDALHLAGELHLVDLDEGSRVRRFRRRTRVADPWGHFQRAELHGLIHGDFEVGNAARHLVEGGEYGDRILDGLCLGEARGKQSNDHAGQQPRESHAHGAGRAACPHIVSLHHAAHNMNEPLDDRSGAFPGLQTPRP